MSVIIKLSKVRLPIITFPKKSYNSLQKCGKLVQSRHSRGVAIANTAALKEECVFLC